MPFQELLILFCLCQQVLPQKANISGDFLLGLRLQKQACKRFNGVIIA